MSFGALYRWSGFALLVGGLIGVISQIFNTLFSTGESETAHQVLSAQFTLGAVLFLAWSLLLVAGLPGFYLRQAPRAGKAGFAGYILISLGLLLGGVALAVVQITIFPYLAAKAPNLLPTGDQGPISGLLLMILGPALMVGVGNIMLGAGAMCAHVFPRWTGILLVISGVLFILSIPPVGSPFSDIVSFASNVIFFIAFAWAGYLLAMRKEGLTDAVAASAVSIAAHA